jgi:hypothetical protein
LQSGQMSLASNPFSTAVQSWIMQCVSSTFDVLFPKDITSRTGQSRALAFHPGG